MSFVKSKAEFDLMKDDIIKKMDIFINDYNEFTKNIKPKYWRESGSFTRNFQNFREQVPKFQQITIEDLEDEDIRDEVFTDEQKEEWNDVKNYNL